MRHQMWPIFFISWYFSSLLGWLRLDGRASRWIGVAADYAEIQEVSHCEQRVVVERCYRVIRWRKQLAS